MLSNRVPQEPMLLRHKSELRNAVLNVLMEEPCIQRMCKFASGE
jgi:hypothetical protein